MTKKTESKTYKKDGFVSLVALHMNSTKKDATAATNAFIESLTEILANGDSVNKN